MLRVVALLAVAACVLVSGPADAHVAGIDGVAFPTGLPWPIVLLALLGSVALARPRARKLVAALLVFAIAILGMEAAVHSVHHGLGHDPVACPTASTALHLHGTTAVALAVEEPIHPVGSVAVTSAPRLVSLCSLDASHPRAPPVPLV